MDKQTNLFRLEEMQEAMELSIANAKKVLHEQEELKTLVENNQEHSSVDFTSFFTLYFSSKLLYLPLLYLYCTFFITRLIAFLQSFVFHFLHPQHYPSDYRPQALRNCFHDP